MMISHCRYLYDSYLELPAWACEVFLAVLCIAAVVAFLSYGAKKGGLMTLRLLLIEYVIMIFCSTILFRPAMKEIQYDYHPFWSYSAIHDGREDLLEENIMNILVFVPVGVMLGCGYRSMTWWKVMLIGGCLSVGIETLQLITKRGFSEFDDVMHNTVGCLVGYGIYLLVRHGLKKITQKRINFKNV